MGWRAGFHDEVHGLYDIFPFFIYFHVLASPAIERPFGHCLREVGKTGCKEDSDVRMITLNSFFSHMRDGS